ncbi:hypothetical protein A2U01_0002902 [Trifolium medium]|uniref:B3 domain-containing protein n=1 Tax=Trifolium medium TaxID=97028 RepID=A0A392M461_9FABA|nr:hypothetical protein [Trifolium medium]
MRVDKEHGTSIADKFITMTTYHLEFDINSPKGKLPGCFAKDLGLKVEKYVSLIDPNLNVLEVLVEKRKQKVYFRDGWYGMKDVYNLHFGGWVKLKYVNPRTFRITINDRFGNEVVYPSTSPRIKRYLSRESSEACSSSANKGSSDNFPFMSIPSLFLHNKLTQLTASDVTSGVLTLPWLGFCHKALPNKPSELTFVDYCGNAYKVNLSFAEDGNMQLAKFSGGWADLCKEDRLVEGMMLRLAVTQPLDNKIVYVRAVPRIAVRTTMLQGLQDGRHVPFYMTERYFIPNV